MTATTLTNSYWDAVKNHLKDDSYYGGPVVNWTSNPRLAPGRHDLVSQFAWTITDPDSIEFVAQHVGPRLLDPMAGTGWWARTLADLGVDVTASDLFPVAESTNTYHRNASEWYPVLRLDGVPAAEVYGADRTLFLSWPPYDTLVGADILTAYTGDRVIYLGEGEGGCCGSDAMFDLFDKGWTQVAEHRPVQWWGIHDYITVLDRAVAT